MSESERVLLLESRFRFFKFLGDDFDEIFIKPHLRIIFYKTEVDQKFDFAETQVHQELSVKAFRCWSSPLTFILGRLFMFSKSKLEKHLMNFEFFVNLEPGPFFI